MLAKPFKITKEIRTVLTCALEKQRVNVVRSFLKKGWRPIEEIGGRYPLLYCSSAQLAKLLIAAGADVNAGVDNWTPLLKSSDIGSEAMIALLLDSGAEVNRAYFNRNDPQFPCGTTALMIAAGHGHRTIVKRLLRAGADLNALDQHGHNALFHALYWDRTSVAKELIRQNSRLTDDVLGGPVRHGNVELVRILISKGANVNSVLHRFESGAHFFEGETLLGCAVRNACWATASPILKYPVKIIRLLLDAGCDVNQPTVNGGRRCDPISIAASWGQERIFNMLKKAGARRNLREAFEGGWTLHGASFAGRTEVVKLLLKAGFSPDEVDKDGKRPADYAAERGHTDIVNLLETAGD